MSERDNPMTSLPTRQQVLAWQEELAREEQNLADMKARHAAEEKATRDRCAKLAKFVEYGLALAEMEALPEAPVAVPSEPKATKAPVAHTPDSKSRTHRPRKGGKSWTATLKRIVVKADRGLSYPEAKNLIAETHLGETLKRTEKAFYGAIGKLAERGDIVKHNGVLFSPKAYSRFKADVEAGRIEDIPADYTSRSGESPNETVIDRFLAARPNGAEPAEIVDHLLNDPPDDIPGTTKNKNSIYNLLARWRRKGKLIRRDGRYYLASQPEQQRRSNGSANLNGGHSSPNGETPDAQTSGVSIN